MLKGYRDEVDGRRRRESMMSEGEKEGQRRS